MISRSGLVAFRVDAGVTMGLGHLSRCLTLAGALRERGAPVLFLISPETVKWAENIEAQGFEIGVLDVRGGAAAQGMLSHAHWLAWSQGSDADACRRRLQNRPAWLIVDHYALDKTWEAVMRPSTNRLMVIDDLADREHCCNLLLDQNLKAATRYDNLVAEDCTTLIGPSYALLRPEFAAARRVEPIITAKRINVFMGGTDSEGATLRVLDDLAVGIHWEKLDVVLGARCPHLVAVQERVGRLPAAELYVDSDRMANLFAAADIGIGAGGVAALERCCVGLPSLGVSVAANQEFGLASLFRQGVVDFVGSLRDLRAGQIAASLRRLMAAPDRLGEMSRKAMALVDGLGAYRVADMMLAK
jgi:UDP-2,4-diacetamido-2,4,6-trideoxy-beta-L-altropyranose hydrolase